MSKYIERFHSRGQHLCKFIETKESVLPDSDVHVLIFKTSRDQRWAGCYKTTIDGMYIAIKIKENSSFTLV